MKTSLAYRAGLLRGLLSGERAPVGPYYVHVDVTHRCNLRCLCCRWHSPLIESRRGEGVAQDFPPELFAGLCDDLQQLGTRMVFFVGTGEPLLHPAIFDFIEQTKRRGLALFMYTNGLALNEQTIRRLIELRLDVLRVSLWTPTAEGFEQQVGQGTAGQFQQIVDGMRLLSRLKREAGARFPELELCVSITQQGIKDLDACVPLAERVGGDRLCFSPLVDFGEQQLRAFIPAPDETRELRETLAVTRRRLRALSIDENIDTMQLHYRTGGQLWRHTPCYPAWFFSYLRSDGKVFLCQRNGRETRAVGDLFEARFAEIWNAAPYRAVRRVAMERGGPGHSGEYFCTFCSHGMNTQKVHRIFRYLRPAARALHRVR